MMPPSDEFADPEFIALNRSFYDKYIDLRVHGHSPHTAFMRVFGPAHWESSQQGYARLEAIENTEYFRTNFEAKLEAVPVAELWNPKKSLNELLCLVRGPHVKDNVKLAAAKELNIMVGIIIVDENGKTKAGRSLSDFYDSQEATPPKPAAPEPEQPTT